MLPSLRATAHKTFRPGHTKFSGPRIPPSLHTPLDHPRVYTNGFTIRRTPGNLWKRPTVKGKVMNANSIRMLPNAAALGVSIPTQRTIRQDPLDEFARALGYRVDEMLPAGKSSRQHLLAIEFDPEEVTTAIAARRPPLEESILRAQSVAVVPLSVLGTARQLVGKITGRLAKLVIESTMSAKI
jgi:hypothetical protein